jgi:hypothetical protein
VGLISTGLRGTSGLLLATMGCPSMDQLLVGRAGGAFMGGGLLGTRAEPEGLRDETKAVCPAEEADASAPEATVMPAGGGLRRRLCGDRAGGGRLLLAVDKVTLGRGGGGDESGAAGEGGGGASGVAGEGGGGASGAAGEAGGPGGGGRGGGGGVGGGRGGGRGGGGRLFRRGGGLVLSCACSGATRCMSTSSRASPRAARCCLLPMLVPQAGWVLAGRWRPQPGEIVSELVRLCASARARTGRSEGDGSNTLPRF